MVEALVNDSDVDRLLPGLVLEAGLPLLLHKAHVPQVPHPNLNNIKQSPRISSQEALTRLVHLPASSAHHQLLPSHTHAVDLEQVKHLLM